MAVAKSTIIFDWRDFVRGMSRSNEMQDAGFSPEFSTIAGDVPQCNLQFEPGVIHAAPTEVDGDGDNTLTDEIVCSCPDYDITGNADKRLVVTADGKYYRYNGTKLGAALQDDGDTYNAEISQMIVFDQATFVSSLTELHKWSATDTFDNAFAAFTVTAGCPHPLLVFEGNLYIGDGNVLKRMTDNAATPTAILTLEDEDYIFALGIDKGTGKILISTSGGGQNVSAVHVKRPKLMWYDGFSNKVSKYVHTEDTILGFLTIGNTTFVGYGQSVGYISGSGVQFLRRLRVNRAQTEMPYQNRMTNIGNTLFVAEDHRVLAYGEIIPGQWAWWCVAIAISGTTLKDVYTIFPVGDNKLGVSYDTTTFSTFDFDNATGILRVRSNKYAFDRPVTVRNTIIEYADAVPDEQNTFGLSLALEGYGQGSSRDLSVRGNTSANLANETGGSIYIQDDIGGAEDVKGRQVQFQLSNSGVAIGVRRILFELDKVE